MKIATYNINGIGARLPRLLEWLERESPDVACLQELKAPDQNFPIVAIRAAGYGAIWHGQTSFNGVAILAKGADPVEIRRGLPGDPDDTHSRYIEAEVNGIVIGCLYLPNGNPQPGPKFEYKLKWFQRLHEHAQSLYSSASRSCCWATTTSCRRTSTSTTRKAGRKTRCCSPRRGPRTKSCSHKAGWTHCANATRKSASTRSGISSAITGSAMPACVSITCC